MYQKSRLALDSWSCRVGRHLSSLFDDHHASSTCFFFQRPTLSNGRDDEEIVPCYCYCHAALHWTTESGLYTATTCRLSDRKDDGCRTLLGTLHSHHHTICCTTTPHTRPQRTDMDHLMQQEMFAHDNAGVEEEEEDACSRNETLVLLSPHPLLPRPSNLSSRHFLHEQHIDACIKRLDGRQI